MMCVSGNPERDWEDYCAWNEKEHERFTQGNAECRICGRTIEDDNAYVYDSDYEFDCAICERCLARNMAIVKKAQGISTAFVEIIEDVVREWKTQTPHSENREGEYK